MRGTVIEFVVGEAAFTDLLARLADAPRYALDTEFHRERTYWPSLALLQLAWEERGATRVCLVDPLAVDVTPLAGVLSGPGLMVAHAAEQDLEILERVCGTGPSRLFDTQLAAGFDGHGSPSLAALVHSYLGVDLAKGDRLTDWTRRPLTESQMRYAAADVDHLLELADVVVAELDRRGRRPWAEEESETLRAKSHGPSDVRRAWWKLRDSRTLRGASRGVAQEVAAWRELRAQALDQPVRTVLPDLAVQAIAHRPPANPAALSRMRGLEGRHLKAQVADEIVAAVKRGQALPAEQLALPPADEVPRELRAPVALIMAWVAQLARDERIDAALLATRADVAVFLRNGRPDHRGRAGDGPGGEPRLSFGWRADLLAGPITALVEGKASLGFDGTGSLVLEQRSGQAYWG